MVAGLCPEERHNDCKSSHMQDVARLIMHVGRGSSLCRSCLQAPFCSTVGICYNGHASLSAGAGVERQVVIGMQPVTGQ